VYAPNVLLAFHVSDWASLYDVGSYTGSDIDVPALGRRVAAFAKRSGMAKVRTDTSAYDVLFNDVADRDSAVAGNWWDRRNVTFPNFHRWERYAGAVHRSTGKPVVVWQIPEGTSTSGRRATATGTPRTTGRVLLPPHRRAEGGRDRRAAVRAGEPRDYAHRRSARRRDEPGVVLHLGRVSGPQVCNAHVSHIADDDGGYLRIRARAYYQDPVTLERPDRGPRGASDR